MMHWKCLSAVTLLAAFAIAAPAAAQPSAEYPDAPEVLDEAPATDLAPTPDNRPGSPEEERAQRDARLDALFARLARSGEGEWKRIQNEIWRMWSNSGSASMDLLLRRADEALEEADDPELALRFLDDLVRLDPDFAEGWNRRATVHFVLDEYGKAVADIERTLALEPRHFGALGGLAMILERLGDKEGAYRAYTRALEIHPHLPGAAEAVKRLAPDVEGREL